MSSKTFFFAGGAGSATSSLVSRRTAGSNVATSTVSLGNILDEALDDCRVERLARFLLHQGQRGVVRHRLVVRTLGHQRVEIVDD